jgi:hypothetical protein
MGGPERLPITQASWNEGYITEVQQVFPVPGNPIVNAGVEWPLPIISQDNISKMFVSTFVEVVAKEFTFDSLSFTHEEPM